MEFSLSAEKIFTVLGYPVTNSLFTTIILVSILCVLAVIVGKTISYSKPSKFQLFLEYVIGSLRETSINSMGIKPSKMIFPLTLTFFFLVILSNWSGLLPITGPLGVIEEKPVVVSTTKKTNTETTVAAESTHEVKPVVESPSSILECLGTPCALNFETMKLEKIGESRTLVPVFRPMTSDLNGTIAFALLSLFVTNYFGFKINGKKYLKKYLNLSFPLNANSIINFFVGILETILEAAKILSFSFRMFGNVFAGEVLLMVMFNLAKGVVSIPFLILELFVGFVQAYVFFVLTTSFTGLAVEEQHH
ncbi:MAG: F0F1 ATP synthase subunit A [bacterium]